MQGAGAGITKQRRGRQAGVRSTGTTQRRGRRKATQTAV
jgi:hypothetical protein